MITQYLLKTLGYHLNFTHYCILTVCSQAIREFIVSLMHLVVGWHINAYNVNLRTEGYNQQLQDQIILSNFMPKINHKLSMHDASATESQF